MKIYKYELLPLGAIGEIEIHLPKHYDALKVDLDPTGTPCLWAAVDPNEDEDTLIIEKVWTGQDVPKGAWWWLGTINEGPLVCHYYAVG